MYDRNPIRPLSVEERRNPMWQRFFQGSRYRAEYEKLFKRPVKPDIEAEDHGQ